MMEHMRPNGLSAGYFCCTCGMPSGMMGHMSCTPNLELVATLQRLNNGSQNVKTTTPKSFFEEAMEALEKK